MKQGYRIISIEAADIYRHEQENGVSVGYKMPESKSDAYFRLFKIYLDNSLDSVELEKAYKRICRKKFSFQDTSENEYTLAVINLKFNYTYKPENGKPIKIKDLRSHFYENGFYLDGVHYVRYKRSAGSSREGKCLFIDERLYKAMDKWNSCGLKAQTDLASWESYKALSLSSIKGTVDIPLDGILFVPDYKSTFTEEVISVELKDGKLVAEQKQTEIINDIWDGESLLDESVFENGYADKHMLLLRNKFFKSCAFRTKLQKWIKDKNITLDDLKTRGFTLATDVSQIVMVTTPNSLKYLKFVGGLTEKNIRKWIESVENTFGVVKWDKGTRFFHGDMVQSTLVVTRELKEYGIEVYFVEDNIWTMDGDGELRLTIMATLAQEESRKISERVRAGQKISRDKGVIYGNGNILGYDRDKATGNYVINEEQAETVRMIYDLYSAGKGISQIRDEMIRRKRKDSSGLVRWENAKVARALHNSVYKGYIAYLKTRRNNYLDQKIILNHDEDTYLYVKGNFEPIISEEQWERCKQIRLQRTRYSKFRTENGEVLHKTGIHESGDVWTKKLKCRCGYKMRKNKWRKNKNGEVIFGYKCYNQLNNGSKHLRVEAGIDASKACDLKEICDWKLEMMARFIFAGLWGSKKDILNNVSSLYQIGVFEEYRKAAEVKATVDKDIAKLDEKLKRLMRLRLEDEIPKDSYLELKKEIDQEKIELLNKRRILDAGMMPNDEGQEEPAKKVEDFLLSKMDFTEHYVDREVIKKFVHTIVPTTETCFNWYMNFDLIEKPNDMRKLVWEFTIDFKQARSYRKEKEGMLRPNQWHDLTVRVFM